ncbi:transcription termination factor Rho, partial [Candidatus Collinsella stercoripullorum]|uniref:transcription termination factor Rho n=1 Tax=Candidatus Collinsella stercoripullorum TaxID=2838522 RepID=UPI0022E34206
EAERAAAAAAAALAQQQAAEEPSAQPALAPEKDVRPGRGRRAKGAPAEERPADAGKAAEDGAKPSKASRAEAREKASQPGRDAKEGKEPKDAKDGGKGADQHAEAAEGGSREGRRRHDRASRNQERNGGRQRADRAERNRNGKRGNRYNVPNEPTLTREELAACKVTELREKARELDLDVTGKKKAELVEEIYTAAARAEGFRDIEGILEIANEGFGYIRAHGYMPTRDDAFVPANLIRAARLRSGDLISGTLRPSRANDKYPGLAKIHTVNGLDPEQIRHRPKFSELTPIYPNEPLKMEHGRESITGRAIDIVSPIGKGQRGLIVSPPKAGKTTVLKHICQSIAINNPEVHLICLLVDERPEEVTDMERSIKGDVVASTFDMPADNHTRVSELVIERAKRIVEMGGDVVVVLDSITRLARAYNLAAPASGRILSGGVDSAALYPPKRFLGAARNIENGGSLTILASALVDTGSKMDEVIFEEFKGTGNMELKLDRDLADRRIFPAIDPVASGTRNEDLLVDENMRPFVWGIRRILANMSNTERAAASFIKGLKGTNSNEEFLIRTAKKAADHPEAL